jgi:hypothetical protein
MKKFTLIGAIALFCLLLPFRAMATNSGNLIVNPSAEVGAATSDWAPVTTIPGWTVTSGAPSIVSYSIASFQVPDGTGGSAFFANGPYGDSSIAQSIDVSSASSQIDTGTITYSLSGWLGGWKTYVGQAVVTAYFNNASGATLATASLSGDTPAARNNVSAFIAKSAAGTVPAGTRSIVVSVQMTNDPANWNTGFADNLSLVLSTPVTVASLTPPVSTVPSFDHVFIIMMENTPYSSIVGSSNAPYINSLISQGTLLTNYYGTYHPSDQNYLSIAGGNTFAVGYTWYPSINVTSQNLGDTIEAAGKTWRAYNQGQGAPGNLDKTQSSDSYFLPDNVPFPNFTDIKNDPARCQAHLFDTTQLTPDLASASTTPNFSWIAADDYYDGEAAGQGDAQSVQVQDGWLKGTIQPIMNSPAWTTQRSLLALVWDESYPNSNQWNPNHIFGILLGSQGLVKSGVQIPTIVNHYSIGRTIEAALGLPPFTANDQYALPLNDAFRPATGVASPPASLLATTGNGQVSLSWTASSGATSYNVYRGPASGGEMPTPVATGITSTTFTNTGLANSTTYYFTVKAVNNSGTSAASNETSVTPPSGIANGTYRLTPQCATGSTLEVSGWGTANGSTVDIWSWVNQGNEQWTLTNMGGGWYKIQPSYSTTLSLEVSGYGSTNGSRVDVWADVGQTNERWSISPVAGGYEVSPENATGQTLNVNGDGSANATNVQTWQWLGQAGSIWTIQ